MQLNHLQLGKTRSLISGIGRSTAEQFAPMRGKTMLDTHKRPQVRQAPNAAACFYRLATSVAGGIADATEGGVAAEWQIAIGQMVDRDSLSPLIVPLVSDASDCLSETKIRLNGKRYDHSILGVAP